MKRIIIFMFMLALSGCAFVTDHVDIKYEPSADTSKIKGASTVTLRVDVQDTRVDKSKVSSKKNDLGMELAPILANEKIDVTLKNAFERELKTRGFNISNTASTTIDVKIRKFYDEHVVGFFVGDAIADIDLLVTITKANNVSIFSKVIKKRESDMNQFLYSPSSFLFSGDTTQLLLTTALEKSMKEVFQDNDFLNALTIN